MAVKNDAHLNPDVYTDVLKQRVKQSQKNFGIEETGIWDMKTQERRGRQALKQIDEEIKRLNTKKSDAGQGKRGCGGQ